MTEQENRNNAGDNQPQAETKALAKTDATPVHSLFPRFPSREDWNTMEIIAKTFLNAGAMPKGIDTAPKLMVILQAGREAGLSPIESLNSLYFVNGKVAMYGEAVPLQVLRAGHEIEWGTCNAETATVTITRGDTGKSMTTTFTMADARSRGYTNNPIYQKYPENMLKWRALSMTAKFICPDALRGIGIKEEMEAEVIEAGGKFEGDTAAKSHVQKQLNTGSISKRPLDAALDAKDEEETKPAEQNKGEELVCPRCGRDDFQTKAGLTKHLKKHDDETDQEGSVE